MLSVNFNFTFSDTSEFEEFLKAETWSGAKDRVKSMSDKEIEALLNYLDDCDANLEMVQLNDFIWFKWNEIYEEMKSASKVYEDLHDNWIGEE